jgi:hypothetical protein
MFYSETQFYKEVKRAGNKVQLQNQKGENIVVDKEYLEAINSHDRVKSEEKVSQTDLINLILSNPKTVMTVYFQKQDTPKTKKTIKEETTKWVEEAKSAFLSRGIVGLEEFATKPVKDYVEGEMRLMKGYHFGGVDERGRIQFKDMEEVNLDIFKAVDPRTTVYVIVNNVKYIKK